MEAFSRAAGRLKGFFDELSGAFLEREDVLTQTALALLSRELVQSLLGFVRSALRKQRPAAALAQEPALSLGRAP